MEGKTEKERNTKLNIIIKTVGKLSEPPADRITSDKNQQNGNPCKH